MASEKPAVDPTVNVSESGGKNVICVSTGIIAVAAALIVIFVPFIAVTVVPTGTPATSTMSPTEILGYAVTMATMTGSENELFDALNENNNGGGCPAGIVNRLYLYVNTISVNRPVHIL